MYIRTYYYYYYHYYYYDCRQLTRKSVHVNDSSFIVQMLYKETIACWKARGWLHIRHIWTFFAISYGWDVISGNLSKSAFFERVGSLWVQILKGRGRCQPTTVGVRKLEWLPFCTAAKYPQCIVWFCYEIRVRQTDRQTELRQLLPR